MKVYITLIIIIFLPLAAKGFSSSISGYVLNRATGEPLVGVNVYISNTTWGSSTDKNGHYEISALPPGNHELVVSMIGYKIESRAVFLKKNDRKRINFRLTEVVYESAPIVVVAADRAEWYRNYDIFKEKFLGETEYARQCRIKNEQVLRFSNKDGRLSARAVEPLIIINKALGYEIHSSIMSFMWNAAAGRVSWMVKNRFIEMKPESEQQHGQWLKKRIETHEQSMSHFLQWLIYRKKDDAYELVLCKRFPVTPLKMHEYFFTVPDSIIKMGEFPDEYILHFDNILRVTFKKTNQISYLKTNQEQITLDAFGFPQEVYAFEVYGYWAKMGMANALPLYFNIDKWLK